MQTHGFLQYAVVLLLAAVIAVPLAKRWQLGAVLGYLAAGALIGPSGIRLIGNTEERPLESVEAFGDFVGRYAELGFTDLVFHHPRPDDPVWNEPEAIVEAKIGRAHV